MLPQRFHHFFRVYHPDYLFEIEKKRGTDEEQIVSYLRMYFKYQSDTQRDESTHRTIARYTHKDGKVDFVEIGTKSNKVRKRE